MTTTAHTTTRKGRVLSVAVCIGFAAGGWVSVDITLAEAEAARRRAESDGSPYIDPEAQEVRQPRTTPKDQFLTVRDGTKVRPEATMPDGRPATAETTTERFKDYIWRQWKAANTWERTGRPRPTSHRFGHEYACRYRGVVLGVDRAVTQLFDGVTTVLNVRRARAFGEHGYPQPMADHLRDLLDGNEPVWGAYRRHLRDKGYRFVRVTMLEPHRHGYIHAQDGLWIEDPHDEISPERFRPAVNAHLRNVPQAQPKNHRLSDAIDVRTDPDRQHFPNDPEGVPPATALPREITKQFGGFAPFRDDETGGEPPERNPSVPPVVQADEGRLRGYALLWATNTNQFRPDADCYPWVVRASQELYENIDDMDRGTAPDGTDYASGGVEMVEVSSRSVKFDRVDGGESLND